jgi:hypothetical protein
MADTEGNATEMVNTLAQSVQTLAARQAAPTEQLKKNCGAYEQLGVSAALQRGKESCASKTCWMSCKRG